MSLRRPTPLQLRFGFPVGCTRCGVGRSTSRRLRLEWHHVTYAPELVTALCRGCHRRITRLNRIRARSLGRRLTNADRWVVWREFLGLRAGSGQTCP